MNLASLRLSGRLRHVCVATITVALLAAVKVDGQWGVFSQSLDGELWGVRYELIADAGANPAGVAYVSGTLFVADSNNRTVMAYSSTGEIVPKPGAQWNAADSASPVYGLVPHQLASVVITVDGIDRNAMLISDEKSNRVAAFDTDGAHLFTLRLDPTLTEDTLWQSIGMVAMSAGARFSLTTSGQMLTLSGSFAAARVEQEVAGELKSGALVFQGSATPIPLMGAEFVATATTVLRGNENDPDAPKPQYMFGVAFDPIGNLYVLDAFTERLHVYGPDLSHLFTVGTPDADGGSVEFQEPWGLAFWPDAAGTGGRLFVNDTYHSRIVIYRPVDGPDSGDVVDALQLESVITNIGASDPPIELFSLAIDQSSGAIAVTDFAMARVVVLQQARLAAFDFHVLDSSDSVVASVCTGAEYKVRFSLTVPTGQSPVTGVTPQLTIDGIPTTAPAVPSSTYPSSTLSAGQVMTYTYTLTAPDEAGADIHAVAGATATNTTDILMRSEAISLGDCAADTDPSTITATPSTPPQVSGWTPVFEGETFSVTLAAQDDNGVLSIEYQVGGGEPVSTMFDGAQTDAVVVAPIPGAGRTTLRYRVRDGNMMWSGWQTLHVNPRLVVNRMTNENAGVDFRIGDPEGAGFTYSVAGLPAGVSFSPATGQFGGVISYDANNRYSTNPAIASGVYTVVVTETAAGGATSNFGFTWTINNINRPPVINAPGDQGGTQGDAVSLQVVASDPDGDALSGWAVTGLPPGLSWSQTGLIEGTLRDDSAGVYYPVHVSVTDGEQPSVTTFKWTVTEVNLAPVANSDSYQTAEDMPLVRAVPGVLLNDTDAELKPLTAILAAGPSHGMVALNSNGSFVYTPAANFNGDDAFTYRANDGFGNSPDVTVKITVSAVNDAPTVSSPDRNSNEGEVINVTIAASDVESSPLTLSAANLPPGLAMAPNGAVTGTLGFEAAGSYLVTVTANDGAAQTSAPFTWIVANTNRPPTANPDAATVNQGQSTAINVRVNDSDPDGTPVTIVSVTTPTSGTAVINTNGTITYSASPAFAGTATFSYTISDGSLGATAAVTVAVLATNRPPICVAAAPPPVIWPANHKTVDVSVGGVSDPDGDALTIRYTGILQDEPTESSGDGNTLQDGGIDGNGARAWVRAERSGTGNGRVYLVSYTATDAALSSCTGVFAVSVPHDQSGAPAVLSPGRWNSITGQQVSGFLPPDAVNDAVSVKKGEATTITVLSNDIANGQTLAVAIATRPSIGLATVNANGTITYQPTAGATGTASFAYKVTTPSGGSDTATVTVTIKK